MEKKVMTYNEAGWIKTYKGVVAALKAENSPTQGRVGSSAAVRYIRDGLLEELKPDKAGKTMFDKETTKDVEEWLRGSFKELIEQVSAKTESGFLSNASAAAKAAGFKPSDVELTKLTD